MQIKKSDVTDLIRGSDVTDLIRGIEDTDRLAEQIADVANSLVQDVRGLPAIVGDGDRLYHVSLAALFAAMGGVIPPTIEPEFKPLVVALAVLVAVVALQGVGRPLSKDEAALCVALRAKGIPAGGKTSLPMSILRDEFAKTAGQAENLDIRFEMALHTLRELKCVEHDTDNGNAVRLVDFMMIRR